MDLNESILQIFNRLAREQKPVNLYNLYKSVPIIHDALVSKADKQGHIKILTHKHQALCMNRDADTIIISDYFPGYIKAKAKMVDLNKKEALLSDFKYIHEKLVQRETVRVAPKEPVTVWFTIKETGFRIKCDMANISIEGLAVHLPIDYYVPSRIRHNAEILLNFQLPIMQQKNPVEINVQGIIKNTMGDVGSLYKRIGMRAFFERDSNMFVMQYVQQRVRDITRELEFTYNALIKLNPK